MAFDIKGARDAGYSDQEIAEFLGNENGFDATAAIKSGYKPEEVISYLTAAPSTPAAPEAAPEKSFLSIVGDNFTSMVKGVAATNPVLGRALTVAQGPQPKKIGSVLEGQQMPEVPFDEAEAERLSRRDYAQEVETRQRQANSPVFKEQRAPILTDRQAFAERNPITAGLAQSAAQTLAGTINIPSVITGLAGETVNRVAGSMGMEAPAGRVPNMPLVDDLKSISQEYASQLSRKSPTQAWDDGDFGRWMMTQLSGNSFSAAQSLGALFVPGAQASLLASMGGIAAGNAYAEGDSASAATMKGLVEIGSEKLPLHAAEKIKDIVLTIPSPVRGKVLADAGKKLLAAGTAVTTNSLVGAIEESAAEVGGNAIDKYISGKNANLFDNVDRAALVGAAFGTAFSAPAIGEVMQTPQGARARELARELQSSNFTPEQNQQTVADMLRTEPVGGANITPEATSIAAANAVRQQAMADIGSATTTDQAIEAAQRAISVPVTAEVAQEVVAPVEVAPESTAAIAQRIQELEAAQAPQVANQVVDVEMTKDGSLRVIGDPDSIRAQLAESAINNVLPTPSGAVVGPAQAQQAQAILSQGVTNGAGNGRVESAQSLESAGTSQPIGGQVDASIPARPEGIGAGVAQQSVPQTVVAPSESTNAQSALAEPISPELLRTYSAPTPRQQTVASQLQARIRATYPDAQFQAVGIPAGRSGKAMAEAADTAKRLFGIDVNYIKFDGAPLFEGVRADAFPNTIFLRADAPKPHMAILGHELLHEMRGTAPELYSEMGAALDALIKNDSQYATDLARRYESRGGKLPTEWREELHADIVGDNFADPQFWADLSREKPGMFERLANAVRQFLNRILLRAKPFGSDAYLNDVKAARDVVSSAVQKFSDSRVRGTAFSVDSTQAQAQNEGYAGNINTPRAGERAVDTDGYRPASEVHQQLADQLLQRVQRAYPNAQFYAVDAPEGLRGQSLVAARTTGKRLFRQDVVFVKFDGAPLFNGAVSDAIPGVVFVRADTDKPHMSVLGHELLHQLRKETPDLYDQLASRLQSMVENESSYASQLATRYERQGGQLPKEWREELYADIVGDNFSNPDFWEAMAKDQPGLFQRVAEAIRKFLDNVLSRAEPFATGQYLRDVQGARDAVAQAMRQFSGTQVGALTSQVDGVAMSVASEPATSQRFTEDNRLSNLNPNGASWQRIRENNPALRGKGPDDTVTVYRATIGDTIRPDDFVAVDKSTLRTELKNVRERDGAAAKIIQQDVRVRDLLMGNDASEFVYFPEAGGVSMSVAEDNTNSNGQPITSTPEALENFRKWFGDSKVVDSEGRPLVMYHGTSASEQGDAFTSFDTYASNYGLMGQGGYFTANPEVASSYTSKGRGATPTVYSAYLSIKNPIDMDANVTRNYADWVKAFPDVDFANTDRAPKNGETYTNEDFYRIVEDYLRDEGDVPMYEGAEIMQEGLRSMGHDGITHIGGGRVAADGVRHRVFVAFDPEQIKSATGNQGTYDQSNPDIRYSLSQSWAIPEESRIDNIVYELQDQKVDLKRVQESIKKAGQQIEEKFDARQAESLYPGRVAYRTEDFLKAEVRPLLQAMALNKVSMNEMADYLHARGAEERNAQIARINPDMPDGGAGTNTQGVLMTNQAAKDYLNAIPADRRKQLDSLAAKVDAITKGTRELLVREGLEKPEVIAAWEAAYKNYVPMFRDEAESGNPHPSGGGFSVRGGNSQRATGSTKNVTNILAHVLMQREAAITKAEKNRVGLALYGLALSNPNTEFWATIRPNMQASQIAADLAAMGVDPAVAEAGMQGIPTIRTVDPVLDRVVDRPNPMYKSLPGALTVKINGEDRVLMFNEKDPRALRMAQSLKNLDGLTNIDWSVGLLNKILPFISPKVSIGNATRWMASVNTQYNPAFGIVNGIRDTFGGAVNLTSTPLRGKSTQVLFDAYTKAGPAIAKELAKPNGQGEWQKLYRQFKEDGGQTGYREMFKDANERTKAIENELKLLEKAGKLTPGKVAHAALNLLDGFNTSIENAVRLSAYKAALDQGIGRAEAAKIGRELTVDFNRKGRAGRELGPLYAFFNASVQGTARTIEALKGPAGARIITGGLVLGALQPLLMAMAGIDDDEIPEFIKTRAFIIPVFGSEKKFVAIPLPLGLHVIPNMGRVLTELALNGGKDIGKRTFEAIGEVAGAFNPLGGGNIFTADGALRTVAPTIADPLIEIGFNKNFAGNQIEKAERGETDVRPGFARARESTQRSLTGQAYLGISKAINSMTGGTPYEAGLASPTPERLQYLAQVAGGGVLRELEKIINVSYASSQGDEIKQNKLPIIGRLFGEVDTDAVSKSRYFEASKKFDKLQGALKAAQKAGDVDAVRKLLDDNPELLLGQTQDKIAQEIAKLNKVAAITIDDREKLKQLDELRVTYMKMLDDAVKQQEQQAGKTTPGQKLREYAKSKREGATSAAR